MSKIKVFENSEFGSVRTIVINNKPYFVGKDVADILGYQNGSRDINRHVDEEDRHKAMIFDGNQDKETILINESGLYSLILSSKLPIAKKFKRWVTHEVLPEIHKTGKYSSIKAENILNDPLLTAPAKTIFMYLSSCAGGKSELITSRSKVLHDLNMGPDMYTNHLDKLKKCGYVNTERIRTSDGRIRGVKFILNYEKLLCLTKK